MVEKKRFICILYGSQTGTAQEVAERIGREAKRRHFSTKVLPLDKYDIVSSFFLSYIPCLFSFKTFTSTVPHYYSQIH